MRFTNIQGSGSINSRLAISATAFLFALGACAEPVVAPEFAEPVVAPAFGAAAAKALPTPPLTWTIASPGSGFGMTSDGAGAYVDGVCTVAAVIQSSGDATFDISAPRGRSCGRTVGIVYPDGITRQVAMFANLQLLESPSIAVGTTKPRRLILNPGWKNGADLCGRIIFGDNGTVGAGTDMVMVTRTGLTSWSVSGAGQALCEKKASNFASSASFTISR